MQKPISEIVVEWQRCPISNNQKILLQKLRNSHRIDSKQVENVVVEHDEDEKRFYEKHTSGCIDGFYQRKLKNIRKEKALCEMMIDRLEMQIKTHDRFGKLYGETRDKAASLSDKCERLIREKDELISFRNGMKEILKYFKDMDKFNERISNSRMNVESPYFVNGMKELDESIQFFSNHSSYLESRKYLQHYLWTQSRGLAYVRDFIIVNLRRVGEKYFNLLKELPQDLDDYKEKSNALVYMKFRTSIEFLKGPINEIAMRMNNSDYHVFLQDSYDCYHQQRLNMLNIVINVLIGRLIKEGSLANFVREGCVVVLQLCTQEENMYKYFFQNSQFLYPQFKGLIDCICSHLYEGLRSLVIQEDSIDTLGKVVKILRTEILTENVTRGISFDSIVHRMVQDIQERLIFRTSVFMKKKFVQYHPKPEDVDYPKILVDNSNVWFPTLKIAVELLSKLYYSVDLTVFELLAQEIISLTCSSFLEASKQIEKNQKEFLDAQLFLIKHFLALRLELSPFDNLNFRTTETRLDFGHVVQGIQRFLQGKANVRMNRIVYDIMSQSQPRIIHTHFDSKENLELQLKKVYESFILNVTRLLLEDIMLLVKKSITKPNLFTQEAINIAFDHCKKNFDVYFPQEGTSLIYQKVYLYVDNPNTQTELIEGIQASLVGTYEEFLHKIHETNLSIENFWTREEFETILKTQKKPSS